MHSLVLLLTMYEMRLVVLIPFHLDSSATMGCKQTLSARKKSSNQIGPGNTLLISEETKPNKTKTDFKLKQIGREKRGHFILLLLSWTYICQTQGYLVSFKNLLLDFRHQIVLIH